MKQVFKDMYKLEFFPEIKMHPTFHVSLFKPFKKDILWHDRKQMIGPCCAPLHEECLKYLEHTWDPGVTPGTCGAIGERAQMILVWVRAQGVGNTSHP